MSKRAKGWKGVRDNFYKERKEVERGNGGSTAIRPVQVQSGKKADDEGDDDIVGKEGGRKKKRKRVSSFCLI